MSMKVTTTIPTELGYKTCTVEVSLGGADLNHRLEAAIQQKISEITQQVNAEMNKFVEKLVEDRKPVIIMHSLNGFHFVLHDNVTGLHFDTVVGTQDGCTVEAVLKSFCQHHDYHVEDLVAKVAGQRVDPSRRMADLALSKADPWDVMVLDVYNKRFLAKSGMSYFQRNPGGYRGGAHEEKERHEQCVDLVNAFIAERGSVASAGGVAADGNAFYFKRVDGAIAHRCGAEVNGGDQAHDVAVREADS
ncbi:uncharacterized protein LTR77_008667 [Saxophila tyrrhenica]|uniref:Uncharacterized protein n=1 Tax=Saxophila tyrrhenica TaxID=1690608 RepID=A0AAV9P0L1_9PEZI|nr:hypothetical protein LTR77_008667 [Saxophila tyrrhenica]